MQYSESLVLTSLFSVDSVTLQMYPPPELEYQYHMTEGCTADGKIFGKLQSYQSSTAFIIHTHIINNCSSFYFFFCFARYYLLLLKDMHE